MTTPASEIRDLFDRIAPVYDQLNNGLSLGQHRVWKRMPSSGVNPMQGILVWIYAVAAVI
jgi:demethylmenaquinone methyltransferase/2-methoxy-6-polyprenyl-1,4-benzoquinol methylase